MKIHTVLAVTLLLAGCTQQTGDAGNPDTSGTTNMPMADAGHEPIADDGPATASTTATPAIATGTIRSIDPAAGTITIAHGPVAALHWPAMTMAFAATPAQIASVKQGQQVQFEIVLTGAQASIGRISATP